MRRTNKVRLALTGTQRKVLEELGDATSALRNRFNYRRCQRSSSDDSRGESGKTPPALAGGVGQGVGKRLGVIMLLLGILIPPTMGGMPSDGGGVHETGARQVRINYTFEYSTFLVITETRSTITVDGEKVASLDSIGRCDPQWTKYDKYGLIWVEGNNTEEKMKNRLGEMGYSPRESDGIFNETVRMGEEMELKIEASNDSYEGRWSITDTVAL